VLATHTQTLSILLLYLKGKWEEGGEEASRIQNEGGAGGSVGRGSYFC
jgi:hypothetical protein